MLPIAREFQSVFILWTLICVTAIVIESNLAIWVCLIWLFLIWFVRDLQRRVPASPLATISPVDGRISAITSSYDPYLQRDAVVYTIQQSYLGEFNLHSPAEGKVQQLWLENADRAKCLSFWTQTDEQDDVVLEIDLNSHLNYASSDVHPGERIGQGQRCGFTAIACTVRVYLPINVKRVGCVNDRVIAGRHTLANFTH